MKRFELYVTETCEEMDENAIIEENFEGCYTLEEIINEVFSSYTGEEMNEKEKAEFNNCEIGNVIEIIYHLAFLRIE